MNKLKYIFIALAAVVASACVQDKVFEEITSVPLKRCLEPMNLSARVDANSGVATTFRWDVTSDAEEYMLEVLDADSESVVLTKILTPKEASLDHSSETASALLPVTVRNRLSFIA